MSFLIFCSYEVGGFPFQMAEILNRHGITTYYISLHKHAKRHDSTRFHFGDPHVPWDLSSKFTGRIRKKSILKKIIKQYSIKYCFATGPLSFLLKKIKINFNYWCFGADLDYWCFNSHWPEHYPLFRLTLEKAYFYFIIRRQYRKSIVGASSLAIAPYQFDVLQKIAPKKPLIFIRHFMKIVDFEDLKIQKQEYKKKLCSKFKATRLFFSSTRHVWYGKAAARSDNKGTDVLIVAFCKYVKTFRAFNDKLILIKKGADVDRSVELTRKLGIETQIVWIDETNHEGLIEYYRGADICFGQFGTPVLTFSAIEPMSQATPTISYFIDGSKNGVPFYENKPVLFNSNNPEKIAEYMHELLSDNNAYDKMSFNTWYWIKHNCSEEKFVESLWNSCISIDAE
jgi:glycosyltransferase involved in cell wall biosynthesis